MSDVAEDSKRGGDGGERDVRFFVTDFDSPLIVTVVVPVKED